MAEQLLGGFLAGAGIARDADETGGIPGKAAGLALHAESGRKAQLLQQFLAVAAVGAKRIGKGIGPPAGHLLDAVEREWRLTQRLHGNAHKLHRVVVRRHAVGAERKW